MSIRVEFVNGYIKGFAAAGRTVPDYKTIYPNMDLPEDLKDRYGNLQYEIEVTERAVNDEIGEHVVKDVRAVKKPQKPTAAQQAAYIERESDRRIALEYPRAKVDRLMVTAIEAMRRGEIDEEYRVYAERRQQIEAEVAAEVMDQTKQIELDFEEVVK